MRRILAGDPAPSVQISVQPISSEGILLFRPLVDCPNEIIREGVRALLAQKLDEAEAQSRRGKRAGWTTFQLADVIVLKGLQASRAEWSQYADTVQRDAALQRFHNYAYQWY